jgi:CRISPR system Cascade subunit CasC
VFIELHILQNFPPSCLNRDDTNTPKDCVFGDHRRARISSQCVKRAVRRYFTAAELLPADCLAERSKRLIGEVARLVREQGVAQPERAEEAVKSAFAAVKLAPDENRPGETQYLLFFGRNELKGLASVVVRHFEKLVPPEVAPGEDAEKDKKKTAKQKKSQAREAVPDEVVKAVKAVFQGGKAADVALFGRMLADQADLNVDAACQVAHAISTNRVDMEMDFFTAVDDLKSRDEEDAGAGMLGTSEFNSACYYRYSNIDLDALVKNLGGDAELASKAVRAYILGSVKAVPTGKQNSTAPQSPPSLVLAVVRKSGLWSLVNAFEKPVRPSGELGLVDQSIRELDKYWGRLARAYGKEEVLGAALFTLGSEENLLHLKEHLVDGLDALVSKTLDRLPAEVA